MIDDSSDKKNSSEFSGWLYDVDFEFLNSPSTKQIIIAGPRCYDLKLRLLIAGLPAEKLSCEFEERDALKYIDTDVEKFYLLHDAYNIEYAIELEKEIAEIFNNSQKKGGTEE
jgi:hypothetical protein